MLERKFIPIADAVCALDSAGLGGPLPMLMKLVRSGDLPCRLIFQGTRPDGWPTQLEGDAARGFLLDGDKISRIDDNDIVHWENSPMTLWDQSLIFPYSHRLVNSEISNLPETEDGEPVTGQLNATDTNTADTLAFSLVEGPSEGSVTVNPNGSYKFDPGEDFKDLSAGETRDVTFTYEVNDGNGGTSTATGTVTETGTNDGPVASDESLSATEDGGPVTGQLDATDIDGDTLTFSLVDGPAEGSVTVNEDGSYSFDPGEGFQDLAAGETREVTFTYQVDDGNGGTSQATATVTVTGQKHIETITVMRANGGLKFFLGGIWNYISAGPSSRLLSTHSYEGVLVEVYRESIELIKRDHLGKQSNGRADVTAKAAKRAVEAMPKVIPNQKDVSEWMKEIAENWPKDGTRIKKPDFVQLFTKKFPRAPVKHAKDQYKNLPNDLKNPKHRPKN